MTLIFLESVINNIKKELKAIYPEIKVSNQEIHNVLTKGVVKREIIEGEESEEAKRKIAKSVKKKEKIKQESSTDTSTSVIQENTTNNSDTLISQGN